jgi:hypothetical protein
VTQLFARAPRAGGNADAALAGIPAGRAGGTAPGRAPDLRPDPRDVGRAESSLVPAAEKPGLGTGISLTLNVISLAMAVGMVIILIYISNAVREVTVLEDRLAGLTQFEKRLSGQVDTVNQGFHSQFDEMNRRLSAMADHLARMQRELETVSARARAMDARLQAFDPALGAAAATSLDVPPEGGEVVLSAPPPAVAVQPPKPAPSRSPPEPSVQFERIISPDGKVTYSKRR